MNELKPEDVIYEYTEGEIVKAWEDEVALGKEIGLKRDFINYVSISLVNATLALLRGKDAEIKELTDDNKWSAKRIIETDKLVSLLKAEVERLNALNKVLKDNNHQCHRLGYEDAITEFALRLKSCEFYEVADRDGMQYIDFCDWVDQIAKEMKGEQ